MNFWHLESGPGELGDVRHMAFATAESGEKTQQMYTEDGHQSCQMHKLKTNPLKDCCFWAF